MESIRWVLAVADVDFEEVFLTSRDQYLKLLDGGALKFQQVPLVEIDGMKLVQTRAILHYIAEKYNLMGKNLKEKAMINMYAEGTMDLMEMIMILPFTPDPKSKLENIEQKALTRYLPVFEEALKGSMHLVGGSQSYADVLLFECTLMLEEKFPDILKDFTCIKTFQGKMSSLDTVKKFMAPGGKRKPQPNEAYVKNAMQVLGFA
uniref:glutathione transferase n=1 Tax=Knipowitschia caucasica TaxID=637954 RepID=A0AAV2JK83_KNICA